MMVVRILFAMVASVACVGCSISMPRFEAREDYKTSIPVDGQITFVANTFNGAITVHESQESSVEIVAHIVARGNTQEEADAGIEGLKPTVENNASELKLLVTKNSERSNLSDSVSLDLKVPAGMQLKLITSNGSVKCFDRRTDVSIKTSNGAVRIERSEGKLGVDTSNGSIDVVDSKGTVSLDSSNGAIHLRSCRIEGNSTIQTSNGAIQIELIPSSSIKFSASTSNGNVSCDISNSDVKQTKKSKMEGVLFGGGDAADIQLDIKTSNGAIQLKEASETKKPTATA